MNAEEFRLLSQIESDHWWFVGKRLILHALIDADLAPGRLLDLGCGTGGILSDWSAHRTCVGLDRAALALRVCRNKGLEQVARGDLAQIPIKPESADTVLALDVIEHLDDDVGFLSAARDLCTPTGRLVVAVPAYQLLWSRHDETFEHRRRYTARQLESVVRRAGFVPERLTYTNTLIFPGAALWRLAMSRTPLRRLAPRTDFMPVPRWLNRVLSALYGLEAKLLQRIDLPFGLSAVCIARRSAT